MEEQFAWLVATTTLIIQTVFLAALLRENRRMKRAGSEYKRTLSSYFNIGTLTDRQKVRIIRTLLNEPWESEKVMAEIEEEYHTPAHQAWIIANQTVKE